MLTVMITQERGDGGCLWECEGGMDGRETWVEELAGLGGRWSVGVEEGGEVQDAALVTVWFRDFHQ